jgi:hypothetical protein
MKNIRPFLITILAAATVVLAQPTAHAASASQIQLQATGSSAAYDGNGSYPIITTILSAPGTGDGYTYNNWSYLAQDPTGSMDMFYSSSLTTGTAWTGLGGTSGYIPHVGDQISVVGNYSPFNGIPEIANSTANPIAVTFGSASNPFYTPSPALTTISTINVGTNANGLNASGLAGTYLQLNNVLISGAGANWAVHANVTGTITDGTGSMTMFLWASSYSTAGAIAAGGGPVPTGPVNMTGFVDDFYSSSSNTTTAEFVPTSITVVPEPATMGLCGLGSVLAFLCYRRCKKA